MLAEMLSGSAINRKVVLSAKLHRLRLENARSDDEADAVRLGRGYFRSLYPAFPRDNCLGDERRCITAIG